MLESTATKREAKAYLSHFGPNKPAPQGIESSYPKIKSIGVNLGKLYLPVRAIDERPVFSTANTPSQYTPETFESLHIALFKIRDPQSIHDNTLNGIGHTVSQLAELGLSCVVIVDPNNGQKRDIADQARIANEQADRLVEVIEAYGGPGARRLDSIVRLIAVNQEIVPSVKIRGQVRIMNRNLLLAPLRRKITPVIAPVGFSSDTQTVVGVDANEVMLALTREFTGLQADALDKEHTGEVAETMLAMQKQMSLDRIIVLDALGGIPSTDSIHGSHVFINLEQEFDGVRKGLLDAGNVQLRATGSMKSSHAKNELSEAYCVSIASSQALIDELTNVKIKGGEDQNVTKVDRHHSMIDFHVKNLELLKDALALLPPSSSAFLTTPDAVAESQSRPPIVSKGPRVRTRRQRNPLIHNLLTDKPMVSSSLPSHRTTNLTAPSSMPVITSSSATFFKRGMPVSIVPDPVAQPWVAPSASIPSLHMSDPRIDLSRLVHLIDDSFNRKLNVTHYLNRIQDRIAGIITAGEYEGGAILTWETPSGYPAGDTNHLVPYLDKFAVLKRSQGAGGVADIVFKAMIRDCFPKGVCWRSRKDNPVNKWYFERARGTWKMPGTNWTMFWTTEGVEIGDQVFTDYESVCKTVEPSWADESEVID